MSAYASMRKMRGLVFGGIFNSRLGLEWVWERVSKKRPRLWPRALGT